MTGFLASLAGLAFVAALGWTFGWLYWRLIKDPDNAMVRTSGETVNGKWRPKAARWEDITESGSAMSMAAFYLNRWLQLGCLSLIVFVSMVATAALALLTFALGLSEVTQ